MSDFNAYVYLEEINKDFEEKRKKLKDKEDSIKHEMENDGFDEMCAELFKWGGYNYEGKKRLCIQHDTSRFSVQCIYLDSWGKGLLSVRMWHNCKICHII